MEALNSNEFYDFTGIRWFIVPKFIHFLVNYHYVKSVQILSFSGPYFPVFGLNTGKYGPEKTPYLDTFHTVLFVNYLLENLLWILQYQNFYDLHERLPLQSTLNEMFSKQKILIWKVNLLRKFLLYERGFLVSRIYAIFNNSNF